MDLLFNRYASPFVLLDGMLSSGRYTEFIIEFLKIHNNTVTDDTLFDVWLHKVFDKSYDDFRRECNVTNNDNNQDNIDFEATINKSMDILNCFSPNI